LRFLRVFSQALTPIQPAAVVGAFATADPSLRSGQALDVPDNRRVFVASQRARPVAEGISRSLALPVTLEAPAGRLAPVAILRPLVQFAVDLAIYPGEGAFGDTRAIVQRPAADDGVEGRDEGGLGRAPVAADDGLDFIQVALNGLVARFDERLDARLPKNWLRQTATPAGESPGLACDSPQSRSPRAGWRFTCADGLPLAQSAARSPKRCFALIPKWEYNSVTGQYDRLRSTWDYAAAARRMNPIR